MTFDVPGLSFLPLPRKRMVGPPVTHLTPCPTRRWVIVALLPLWLLLVGCGGEVDGEGEVLVAGPLPTVGPIPTLVGEEASGPLADLVLADEDVSVEPLPLRAGFPFTVTAIIHNQKDVPAANLPLMLHISAKREEIGYTPFLQVLTVTVPASESLPVELPVNWNFAGGEHQLWVQVNRLPSAWTARIPVHPEADTADNAAILDLMVDPFDAYTSDLCSGRVDVEIAPADILAEPDAQRIRVRILNVGHRAVYHLPVVVTGKQLSGISYTPAIPPCGGSAEVVVDVDRPFRAGESLTVQVNPSEWPGSLEEDSTDNNRVTVTAGLVLGEPRPASGSVADYDFRLDTADIETPELWTVMVTVHNLGTRDAADVPLRVENEAGRKIVDTIPLVQGQGMGVAAIRVGYLWTPGGTLTFTVNPGDVKGAYAETDRENNVATFTLP